MLFLNFQDFLLLEEFTETRDVNKKVTVAKDALDNKINRPLSNLSNGILARNICAKWNPNDMSDAIRDITFEIKNGECYGICGSVGDGKVKIVMLYTNKESLLINNLYLI